MAAAADDQTTAATDLAEWLVGRGTPFREAHAIVGELVRHCIDTGTPLAELVELDRRFGAEAAALVAPGVAVRRRTSPGGGGPGPVAGQIERFGETIRRARERLA
jgi:argininosuccinate lyase